MSWGRPNLRRHIQVIPVISRRPGPAATNRKPGLRLHKLPAHWPVAAASALAVGLWALKPVFINTISNSVGFVEAYLLAGAIAVACSLLLLATVRPLRRVQLMSSFWVNAGLCGSMLAVWYYGFYRALYTTGVAEATIVAFTWPLIAAIALPILVRGIPWLRGTQWLFVVVAFAGGALVTMASTSSGSGDSNGIWWAVFAAFGSGLYLPFALRAAEGVQSKRPLVVTTWTISIANIAACLLVAGMSIPTTGLSYSDLRWQTVLVCVVIGCGTYLSAEIAWTWAIGVSKSPKLGALPYLSPAVSVILLWLLFGEPLDWKVLVGLLVVVGANLGLHLAKGKPAEEPGTSARDRATPCLPPTAVSGRNSAP